MLKSFLFAALAYFIFLIPMFVSLLLFAARKELTLFRAGNILFSCSVAFIIFAGAFFCIYVSENLLYPGIILFGIWAFSPFLTAWFYSRWFKEKYRAPMMIMGLPGLLFNAIVLLLLP